MKTPSSRQSQYTAGDLISVVDARSYRPFSADEARSSLDQEHLTQGQREAVQEILGNREQVYVLEGVGGAGKTAALTAVRQAIKQEGFKVQGLAPTSHAAHQLETAGIEAMTLSAPSGARPRGARWQKTSLHPR